ncbi:unnamed protein product [Brachionus calyciflorus]|uniref:MYND-type domain-containing protein n=1 Tax=Brachionus calyciflorus TaxID=104777 RepID=A0A813PPY4_9BILA|nr:unnamed protein product [Brachionus calyciflorus]
MSLPKPNFDSYILEPFVYTLNFGKRENHCDFCLTKRTKPFSCPECNLVYHCNRKCQDNDKLHYTSGECSIISKVKDAQKKDLQALFHDNFFQLYLRLILKLSTVNCDELVKDDKSLDKFNNLKKSIEDLIGDEIFRKFTRNELLSIYGKMVVNNFEIKTEEGIIGFGLFSEKKPYLELSFSNDQGQKPLFSFCEKYKNDDDRRSFARKNFYIECECFKCINIMKDFPFPVLQFSEDSSKDPLVKKAIRIANKFLVNDEIRLLYKKRFKIRPKPCLEKMPKVVIVYEKESKENVDECGEGFSWTYREDDKNETIYINDILEKRLKILQSSPESLEKSTEIETIVVFISFLLLHELAHLLFRWNGQPKTPNGIDEAGLFFENRIFNGYIHILIDAKTDWSEYSEILGICIEKITLKQISYQDYVREIFYHEKKDILDIVYDPKSVDKEKVRAVKHMNKNKEKDDQSLSEITIPRLKGFRICST